MVTDTMTNPNNCDTCDYKQMRGSEHDDKQHCYMFYDSPVEQCMQHTGHRVADTNLTNALRDFVKFMPKDLL
jgi:hypothetical protein